MADLQDFNFIEVDPQTIKNEMISEYEELTGRRLAEADPVRLFILAQADKIIQLATLFNYKAKQNLLYFAEGTMLDLKGYEWNTPRNAATAATTTMRFVASTIQATARTISKGTLVTAGDEVWFETIEVATLAANYSHVDVVAKCLQPGEIGNGYEIGQINTMVQPIPFIAECLNLTESTGGTDTEDSESYKERIRQAPEKLAAAGPIGAYEYHARSASVEVSDVKAYQSNPGEMTVKILAKDGSLPSQALIELVESKLSARSVRPATDMVIVEAPDIETFNTDIVYYLPSSVTDVEAAKTAIESAYEEYKVWQTSKMGRDINPSQLIWLCMKAGAKRIDVTEPQYQTLNDYEVAQVGTENLVFGGVENE